MSFHQLVIYGSCVSKNCQRICQETGELRSNIACFLSFTLVQQLFDAAVVDKHVTTPDNNNSVQLSPTAEAS